MKRLLSVIASAAMLATLFVGTPKPVFAVSESTVTIGYWHSGGASSQCYTPDIVIRDEPWHPGPSSLEEWEDYYSNEINWAISDALTHSGYAGDVSVDDGDTIKICSGEFGSSDDTGRFDGNMSDVSGEIDPITLTIKGAGFSETHLFASGTRLFNFIRANITLEDFMLHDSDSAGDGNRNGGAVLMQHGDLVVNNVEFDDSDTYDLYGNGQAIAVYDGNLTVTNAYFDRGEARQDGHEGGAIYVDASSGAQVSITNVYFDDTEVDGAGGAIAVHCASTTIDNAMFNNTYATNVGGAIYAAADGCDSSLTVSNSRFRYSSTDNYGGGPGSSGGAIYVSDQDTTITDSAFGNNFADHGGAIDFYSQTAHTFDVSGTHFFSNSSNWNGGAIRAECANLTITGDDGRTEFYGESWFAGDASAVFRDNTAGIDGFDSNGVGGAIVLGADSCSEDVTTTIDKVVFEQNGAPWQGGAIASVQDGELNEYLSQIDISASSFVDNSSGQQGGAINLDGYGDTDAVLSITDSLLLGNHSRFANGGAMELNAFNLESTNTAYWYNAAKDGSGAIRWANSGDEQIQLTDSSFFNNVAWHGDGGALGTGEYGDISELHINGSLFQNNMSYYAGGAIYADLTTFIDDTQFIDNSTGFVNGSSTNGDGGALCTSDDATTITNSLFEGNHSNGYGGAIACEGEGLTIGGTRFRNNSSHDHGGAIDLHQDGVTSITGSSFTGNTATDDPGGAIGMNGGAADIRNTTFSNNAAEGGGAIWATQDLSLRDSTFTNNHGDYNGSDRGGGAINVDDNVVIKIFYTTFVGNTGIDGGAIDLDDDGVTLNIQRSTFTSNTATDGDGGAIDGDDTTLTTISFSVFSKNSAALDGGAVHMDAETGILEDNVFRGNHADEYGGGVWIDRADSKTIVSRNTFDSNSAMYGAGLAVVGDYIDATANKMWLHTNKVYGNAASVFGGGFYLDFDGVLPGNVKANTFSKNSANNGGALAVVGTASKAALKNLTRSMKGTKYSANRSKLRGGADGAIVASTWVGFLGFGAEGLK